jgi:RNA polymerase sigma-70 factor (ECF subfamily)
MPMPIAADDDASLAEALRAGHPGATVALLQRYGSYVERLLVRTIGSDPIVTDLLQEVFTRVLENVQGDLKQPESLKGWVGSVAIFTARSYLRNQRSRRRWLQFMSSEDIPEAESPHVDPEMRDTVRRTYGVLDRLPVDERIVFTLRIVQGLDVKETAKLCGISEATVKRRYARAQDRFVKLARKDPMLCEWLESGTRWGPDHATE